MIFQNVALERRSLRDVRRRNILPYIEAQIEETCVTVSIASQPALFILQRIYARTDVRFSDARSVHP